MAATLTSTGVNPVTGERVVRETRSATCWQRDGLLRHVRRGRRLALHGQPPGEVRVAGGIIAVPPGQLGVAAYSPPDLHGNSVRGSRSAKTSPTKLRPM